MTTIVDPNTPEPESRGNWAVEPTIEEQSYAAALCLRCAADALHLAEECAYLQAVKQLELD